jgi:hypothetical protein
MSFSSQEHPLLIMSITTWHDANVYILSVWQLFVWERQSVSDLVQGSSLVLPSTTMSVVRTTWNEILTVAIRAFCELVDIFWSLPVHSFPFLCCPTTHVTCTVSRERGGGGARALGVSWLRNCL